MLMRSHCCCVQVAFYKHVIQIKAYTEWIWLCYKIRAAQTSDTQTDNTHQPAVYSYLIPFGIEYWHQTLSHCWACTNFATMFKDTAGDKQEHANKGLYPESKHGPTAEACVFVFLMDYLSCLVIVLHNKRDIINYIMYITGNMAHTSGPEIDGISSHAR